MGKDGKRDMIQTNERGKIKKKGIGKRAFSWMLVFIMVISMLPTAKRAEARANQKLVIHEANGYSFSFNGTTIKPDNDSFTYTFTTT